MFFFKLWPGPESCPQGGKKGCCCERELGWIFFLGQTPMVFFQWDGCPLSVCFLGKTTKIKRKNSFFWGWPLIFFYGKAITTNIFSRECYH